MEKQTEITTAQQAVAANLSMVTRQIDIASQRAARADRPRLVAVSKRQPDDRIDAALDAGHRVFGENRVQEAFERWQARKLEYPTLELHLIGPLQSNKAQAAVALFDVIHTVDRPKIATALAREMTVAGRSLPCFIQVNTSEEDQKAGVLPRDADGFIRQCRDEFGLAIAGLMCIPPVDDDPAPHFALLRKIAERNEIKGLSMGMSADFEQAVRLGATHVRVGSAIFGARPVGVAASPA